MQTGSELEHSFNALPVCVPITLPQPPPFVYVEFKEQPEMQAQSPLRTFQSMNPVLGMRIALLIPGLHSRLSNHYMHENLSSPFPLAQALGLSAAYPICHPSLQAAMGNRSLMLSTDATKTEGSEIRASF